MCPANSYEFGNLYISLLKEEIDAIIIDKPIAEYYSKHFDKLTYFSESISNNSYGFGFFNETLKNEFNEFLGINFNESQLNKMLDNWINNDSYEIDKDLFNLDGTKGTIKYLLDSNKKPIAFLENEIPKGFELELLYKFAKEYGYKIKYGSTLNQDGTLSNDFDVYLGCLNINNNYSDYFGKTMFSNPIYNSSTVLAIKTKNKKDCLTIQILDKDYNYNYNNIMQILTKILDQVKNISCTFPKEYNDTILINCSFPDFDYNINETIPEINLLNTTDIIKITHSTIKPTIFFYEYLILNVEPSEYIDNETNISEQKTDIYSYNKSNEDNDEGSKEDEESAKSQKKISSKSSDNGLSIPLIIGIISGVIGILLIIIIACVVRKLSKKKDEHQGVKIPNNSSNEINVFSSSITK